jgi:hypothetical protein
LLERARERLRTGYGDAGKTREFEILNASGERAERHAPQRSRADPGYQ